MHRTATSDHRRDAWDHFWKDRHGNVVIYQHPNYLLIGWLLLTIASLLTVHKTSDILWYAAMAVLAGWSLLELFAGINYFRRFLGGAVLVLIILALFKVGY